MKRIMKEVSTTEHWKLSDYPQGIMQDGIVDWIADDNEDHSGPDIMYCSQHQMVDEDDGQGNTVKVKREVVLVPLNIKVKIRPTFAGYDEVGNEDEQ